MILSRQRGLTVIFGALLAVLMLSSCGGKQETEPVEPIETAVSGNMEVVIPGSQGNVGGGGGGNTADPVQPAELRAIERLIDEGRFYEAFREMLLFEEKNRDSASIDACEALYDRLEALVRVTEPKSGTELMRTFRYYGGCELQAVAQSGPLLITVTDAGIPEDESVLPPYSRFYVRNGETGTISLPAGVYHVSYQVGYLWFDEETGFGDYWTGGELDRNVTLEVSASGSLINNSRCTLTF